jgi:hypothetical protein
MALNNSVKVGVKSGVNLLCGRVPTLARQEVQLKRCSCMLETQVRCEKGFEICQRGLWRDVVLVMESGEAPAAFFSMALGGALEL